MDQIQIGQFLKQLRKDKSMTQEQLADVLGVSNRSVSRWENGNTMPDFDLLIEMTKIFDTDIAEILNGKRSEETMHEKQEQTLKNIADYHTLEKMKLMKRLHILCIMGMIAFLAYLYMIFLNPQGTHPYEEIEHALLGSVLGVLFVITLFTSRFAVNIRTSKLRLMQKMKNM